MMGGIELKKFEFSDDNDADVDVVFNVDMKFQVDLNEFPEEIVTILAKEILKETELRVSENGNICVSSYYRPGYQHVNEEIIQEFEIDSSISEYIENVIDSYNPGDERAPFLSRLQKLKIGLLNTISLIDAFIKSQNT